MLLSAEAVTKTYGDRTVRYGVSLSLETGDMVGVVGHNGGGKSTLLRLLAGAEEPDSGSVLRDPNVRLEYLPQAPKFEPSRTVLEQVLLGLSQEHRALAEYEAKATLTRLGVRRFDQPMGELSGGEPSTTNNRMELTGVIAALEALKEPCEIDLYSDSKYVIDALEKGWAEGWRRRGWIKPDKKPALNPDLWERLLDLIAQHTVRLHWVKGHAQNVHNNRCDELAVAESRKFKQG